MLEKYINWDNVVVELLKNQPDHQIALQNLRDQYSRLIEGAEPADATAESNPQDGLVDRILQRKTMESKILELSQEETLYTRAWEALSEEDRRILQEFFQRGQRPAQQAVDILCELYGYERATIYRMRTNALKRLKRLIAG